MDGIWTNLASVTLRGGTLVNLGQSWIQLSIQRDNKISVYLEILLSSKFMMYHNDETFQTIVLHTDDGWQLKSDRYIMI